MSNFKHFGKKLFFSIQNDQTLRKISYLRMIWTDLRNILSVRPPLYGKKQVAFKWIFRWFYAFWDPIFFFFLENDLFQTHPPTKVWKIPNFFFILFFEPFPYPKVLNPNMVRWICLVLTIPKRYDTCMWLSWYWK